MPRTILHCDCNNFYASVEQLYHPELRGRPIAVVGDQEQRHGIVLAKNYAAKSTGIRTGNPIWLAQQLCPDLVLVPPDYPKYERFSRLCREIYGDYTDQVEPYGLDECWLDVSGSSRMGDGVTIANALRDRIKRELGITISAGVSFNKVFAKLGSDMRKPDATTVIPYDGWQEIVWPLPASDMLYVGPAAERLLGRYCIRTIGALAKTSPAFLHDRMGKCGEVLWSYANGYDNSAVSHLGDAPPVKSVGNSTTMTRDMTDGDDLRIILYILSDSVAERLRAQDLQCRTIQVSMRWTDLSWIERQTGLESPSCNAQTIFDAAYRLYQANHNGRAVRSIGVRGCNLGHWANIQTSLLADVRQSQRRDDLDHAVDDIRRRFGRDSIRRGIMLLDPALSSLDPASDHPSMIAGAMR